MPADKPASTPGAESSSTRHRPGVTPRREAASRKRSGAGLPFSAEPWPGQPQRLVRRRAHVLALPALAALAR